MNKRDILEGVDRDVRGLGGEWRHYQRHAFGAPSPDLAAFVERYWHVSWDYAEPYRQLIVPYPNVHLSFRDGRAEVHGVSSGYTVKVLSGAGTVFGVAFRPGCFRPFLGSRVAEITDRSIPASAVFRGVPDGGVDTITVERFLRNNLPDPDPGAQWVADVVDRIARDPGIRRVGDLAATFGTGVRRLQRLFAEYAGVGPKWVIRRYRLREVTRRMERGDRIDWAGLAADLGYADQAHLSRDFRGIFGESPTHYAARY